jgi:hypothetical protein
VAPAGILRMGPSDASIIAAIRALILTAQIGTLFVLGWRARTGQFSWGDD